MTSHLTNHDARKAGLREEVEQATGRGIHDWHKKLTNGERESSSGRSRMWSLRCPGPAAPPVRDRDREDAGTPRRTRRCGDIPTAATAQGPETAPGLVPAVERRLGEQGATLTQHGASAETTRSS